MTNISSEYIQRTVVLLNTENDIIKFKVDNNDYLTIPAFKPTNEQEYLTWIVNMAANAEYKYIYVIKKSDGSVGILAYDKVLELV